MYPGLRVIGHSSSPPMGSLTCVNPQHTDLRFFVSCEGLDTESTPTLRLRRRGYCPDLDLNLLRLHPESSDNEEGEQGDAEEEGEGGGCLDSERNYGHYRIFTIIISLGVSAPAFKKSVHAKLTTYNRK